MTRFGLLLTMSLTACAAERRLAGHTIGCPAGELTDLTSISSGDVQQMQSKVSAADVTAAIALGILFPYILPDAIGKAVGDAVRPARAPGGRRVWVGCSSVAVCKAEDSCERADWMTPKMLPALMARSLETSSADLGVERCEAPPVSRQIGAGSWDIELCGNLGHCFVVTTPNQYECQFAKSAPWNVAPAGKVQP